MEFGSDLMRIERERVPTRYLHTGRENTLRLGGVRCTSCYPCVAL